MTFDLSPAPGRHPVPLGRGWTAVFLALMPGGPFEALGVFRDRELEALLEEPREVRWLAEALGALRHGTSGSAGWSGSTS
jgi:hypothetical protein